MKIATWNVNSIRVRLPQVLAWLQRERPDVLGLQETKITDEDFPAAALREAGYHAVFAGQKTYNGVAILSRTAPAGILTALPGVNASPKRLLAASIGGLRLINVYVPNGEAVGAEKYSYKLEWLEALGKFLAEELKRYPLLALVGDFNIAPQERDVHDPRLWAGRVLFSDPERAAFRRLLEQGLVDVFRCFEQPPQSFSWWDYRMDAFRRNLGLRIDHILATPALASRCRACRIDRAVRAHERPSDHAPVVAEFDSPD
jgi:exodeoxyribonuclease-3